MSGYIHDPLQIINLIADNIRDRYKTGFSVIKEVIQNADDSGGSDSGDSGNDNDGNYKQRISFEFGLSPGIPAADHPLLKGPGLFFFNDGRFKQSDAIAIRSFGLNRKAIDEATIGKFGLGMKSVFHFCEALFFLALDKDRSYAEILNPWSGPVEFQSLHSDWDRDFSQDAESLKDHLDDIIGSYRENSDSWFLLWLPLRSVRHTKKNEHEIGSIVGEFPGDDLSHLEFLNDPEMPMRFARLLPLLRRIVSIRFWEFKAGCFKTVYRIFMESPDSRIQLPTRSNSSYSGHIQYENQTVSGETNRLVYTGLERQSNSQFMKNLKQSEFWPRSYVRDENGQSVQAPDKAEAHCAVVFSRYGATDEGNLDIRWAVFLPIETGLESISCDGKQSYCLTLHGYFFVDAGRAEVAGLHPSDPLDYEIPPTNEAELRHQWNKYLSQSGTLPLVIPSLVEFARKTGLNKTEIDNLCKALSISKTFKQNRHAICENHQFVLRLKPDRARWALIRNDALLLPLPTPPATEQSRPWNTLRYLDALEGEPEFIQDDAPHLTASANPPTWNESQLEKVLDIDVSIVFRNEGLLNYLCLFLARDYIRLLLGREAIQSRLQSILRSALRTYGQNLTQFRTRFREVAAHVLPIYRFPVTAPWTEALTKLLQCQTDIVVLPKEMDSTESPGKGSLSIEDAVTLLRKIGNIVNASTQNPEMLNECRQLSPQIISSVSIDLLPEVFRQVRSEKIIDAFDCNRNRRWLFSIEELVSCQKNDLLFLFSQGTTDEQRLYLASALQQAIHEMVLVINTSNAQITLGKNHGLTSCNSEGCLRALGKSALTLTGLEQREELIKRLTGATLDSNDLIRGMRYLLHGTPERFEDDQPLWTRGYQQDAVWEKMWRQLPENSEEHWNLLNQSLIRHIPQNSWVDLDILEINPQEILNRFREVGFDQIDRTIFSREERDTVLIAAEKDCSLWRTIPFHETLNEQLTSIQDKNAFLESGLQLPQEFQDTITIVRLSENQRVQVSQHDYIPVLDDESLIRILLESQQPHIYWNDILDALQRAFGSGVTNRKLRELLRESCWLIDTKGRPVRPSDVINLEPIADEVCRLSTQIEGIYVAPELIDNDIRQHPHWGQLANQFFASGNDGLEKLGLLLGDSSTHAIGEIRYREGNRLKVLIDVLRDVPTELDLPSWSVLSVVESAYGAESCDKQILPNIKRPLSIDRTVGLLEWLKNRSEACNRKFRNKVIDVYECYLDVFVRTPEASNALPGINLLNVAGGWRFASELCADAEGVAPEDLIHDRQKEILKSIIQSAGQLQGREGESQGEFEEDVYEAVAETAERLKTYFTPWEDQVPPDLIRVFLSLLGDDKELLRLSESYEGSHSIDWIRTNLPWTPNMHQDRNGRRDSLYGLSQNEAIKQHRFIVEPVPGQTIQVRSLCDSIIDVRLSQEYDSLIVGGLWWEWPEDNLIFPKIRLRQIDVEAFSPEQLSALLRNTAEYLLQNAYSQGDHDLESLWSEMGEGEQLDIRVAQLLVMKHIPYYLRTIGTHQHEKLMTALKKWNDARYRVAEFSDHPEQKREFEAREFEALENIQNLLLNDQEVQQTVLEAVRSKITDFQYSPASILFELFQNADDALVELCEIRSYINPSGFTYNANLPLSANRLVLQKAPDHLNIMHWGRAINYAGGSSFPGRERGFHQDLEKMLILSSSDKNTGESGVTGKFGLGFKSVFLISDAPKLISGHLHAEILGGMYPKRYEGAQPLKALLKEEAPEGRGGTLIHLPLDVGKLEEVCEPFEKMAGPLTIFSKQIRFLEVDQNGRREIHEWTPTIVVNAEEFQIEYGSISLASKKSEAKTPVLYFRFRGGGGLLVGIGPQGFREIPEGLPTIWVVAPTHEDTGIGFAINGRFEVDAGRARLSNNDESTILESQRIGEILATGLLTLFDEAENDWDRFRKQLRLGNDLRPYDFWASVWHVLTNAWGQRVGGKVAKIVVNIMADERGLGRLARDRMAVPTGLWGNLFQTLTCSGNVRYIIRGALSQERIFQHFANWDVFQQKIKPKEVISSQVFETLRKVNPEFAENKEQWQSLKISGILNWLAENDYQVTPTTAAVLGQVITSDFMAELQATSAGQNEASEIVGMLRRIKFKTKPGDWREPRYILISRPIDDISDDEPLRAAFAPHDLLLSDTYEEHGTAFLMVCRVKMEAPVEDMASWFLDTEDTSTRRAALRYLLDGELGDRLSRHLREKGISGSWLEGLNRDDEVFHGWAEDDIYEILYRKLPSIDQLREVWWRRPDIPKLDPAVVLPRIKDWWLQYGESLIEGYEEDTYPEAKIPYLEENETGKINRENWLILFLLGAFHILGRSRRGQHKAFIQICQQNGWWDTFAAESPETHADDWMQVLDKYIDAQVDDSRFEMWMNRFPSIYRVARHLDDYMEAFLSIDRHETLPDLGSITVTRANLQFQGGGISAPPIRRTFGIGACFVVRELRRAGLLTSRTATPHCYVPVARVRRLMSEMDCPDINEGEVYTGQSKIIHRFLCEHLGEREAEFQGDYDIPLQITMENRELQIQLLGRIISEDSHD